MNITATERANLTEAFDRMLQTFERAEPSSAVEEPAQSVSLSKERLLQICIDHVRGSRAGESIMSIFKHFEERVDEIRDVVIEICERVEFLEQELGVKKPDEKEKAA